MNQFKGFGIMMSVLTIWGQAIAMRPTGEQETPAPGWIQADENNWIQQNRGPTSATHETTAFQRVGDTQVRQYRREVLWRAAPPVAGLPAADRWQPNGLAAPLATPYEQNPREPRRAIPPADRQVITQAQNAAPRTGPLVRTRGQLNVGEDPVNAAPRPPYWQETAVGGVNGYVGGGRVRRTDGQADALAAPEPFQRGVTGIVTGPAADARLSMYETRNLESINRQLERMQVRDAPPRHAVGRLERTHSQVDVAAAPANGHAVDRRQPNELAAPLGAPYGQNTLEPRRDVPYRPVRTQAQNVAPRPPYAPLRRTDGQVGVEAAPVARGYVGGDPLVRTGGQADVVAAPVGRIFDEFGYLEAILGPQAFAQWRRNVEYNRRFPNGQPAAAAPVAGLPAADRWQPNGLAAPLATPYEQNPREPRRAIPPADRQVITQAQNAAPGSVNRPVADELRRWEEARNLRNLGIANPRPWAPLVRTTGQAAPDPYWGGAPYQIDDPVLAHETANPPFIRRENARP